MDRRILLTSLLIIAVVSLSGCTQSATMHVWRPSEVNLDGVRRIAVIDFEGVGETGAKARSALTAQLWDNRHFEVVDIAELTRFGYQSSGGSSQVASALQAAEKANVDAILTGQVVSYDVDDQRFQSQSFNVSQYEDEHDGDDRDGHGHDGHGGDKSEGLDIGFANNDTLVREATVGVAFRLIDVKSGKVLASRHVSKSYQGSVTNGDGFIPTRDRITTDLMHDCAADVLVMIAPFETPVDVSLLAPVWSTGSSTIRSGNEQAQLGDWEAAEAKYEQALEENPESDAAMHNLAIARAALYDYPAAEATIRQALETKKKSAYSEMLTRITDYGERYNQVTRQRVGQIAQLPKKAPNPASPWTTPEHAMPARSFPNHIPKSQLVDELQKNPAGSASLTVRNKDGATIEQPPLSVAPEIGAVPYELPLNGSPASNASFDRTNTGPQAGKFGISPPAGMSSSPAAPIIMAPSRQSGFEESPTAGGY
jgi:tetratricopeptide (TPR) repeat protein